MIQRGLTENDIAKMLAIKPSTVLNWITKGTLPRANRLYALSAILGVSTGQLFTEEPLLSETEKLQKHRRQELEQQLLQTTKELLDFKTTENERLKYNPAVPAGQ